MGIQNWFVFSDWIQWLESARLTTPEGEMCHRTIKSVRGLKLFRQFWDAANKSLHGFKLHVQIKVFVLCNIPASPVFTQLLMKKCFQCIFVSIFPRNQWGCGFGVVIPGQFHMLCFPGTNKRLANFWRNRVVNLVAAANCFRSYIFHKNSSFATERWHKPL